MNSVIKIILLFSFTACATIKSTRTDKSVSDRGIIETVGFEDEASLEQSLPGATEDQNEDIEISIDQKIKSGFYFAPGVYRTLKILGTLKSIDRANAFPDYLSGSEWGAIIALYLGKNGSVSLTEWDIFELLRKLEDEVPYSSDWKKIIIKKLSDDFNNIKFDDFKIKVILPVWNKTTGMQLISSGQVVDILPALFHTKTMNCESMCSLLEAKEINLSALKSQFSGYWVMFDYLPPALMAKVQGFEMGLFKITESKIKKNHKYFDLIYRDSKDKFNIDEKKNAHDFLRRGELLGQDFLTKYRNAQKTWVKKKNL